MSILRTPAIGLHNETGTNCWMNSAFQLACNIPSYRKSLEALPENQELLKEQAKTSVKTHLYVVLSYLLIGIGITLACLSFYFVTFVHPMIAMSSPVVPIALGVLGIQMQGEEDKKKHLSGNFPLLSAFKQYQQEQASHASISSVSTQQLREWLYDATVKNPAQDDVLLVTSRDGQKQEDPRTFFLHFLKQTNQFLPPVMQTTISYSRWGREIGRSTRELTEEMRGEPYLSLEVQQFSERPLVTAKELLNSFFFFQSTGSKGVNKTSRRFVTPPNDLTLHLKRFHTEYSKEGVVQSQKKVKTEVEGLAHYVAPESTFGEKAEYVTDGFIVHLGESVDGGHCVGYVLIGDQWWVGNDRSAKMITKNEAEEAMKTAYILHMQKVSTT